MMRLGWVTHFFVVLLLVARMPAAEGATGLRPPGRPATASDWERFAGVWYPEVDAAAQVEQVVRQATTSMFPLAREVARSRLMNRCAPPRFLRMQLEGESFVIEFAGAPVQRLPRSGATKTEPDGRTLSARVESELLRHDGASREGTRENLFRVGPMPNQLTMQTTVTSPRLPQPVRFTVHFTRAGPEPR